MTKKTIVTSPQLFTLIFVSRISLTLITTLSLSGTRQLWELLLPDIIMLFLTLLLLLPIMLLQKHGGILTDKKNITGITLRLLYGLYFAALLLYTVFALREFLVCILPDGLYPVLLIGALLLCGVYAASKGIEGVCRLSLIVLILFALALLIVVAFLSPGYNSENLIPLKALGRSGIFTGVLFMLSRSGLLAGAGVLSVHTANSMKNSITVTAVLLSASVAVMLLIATGVLGDFMLSQNLQIYDMIGGSGALQRLNPFFLIVTACCVFCDVSFLLLSFSQCFIGLSRKIRAGHFAFICAAVVFAVLLFTYDDENAAQAYCDKYIWSALTVTFVFLIPMGIFAAKALRRIKPKRAVSAVLAAVLCCVFMCSCNAVQLNERMIIQGIAIDKTQTGVSLSLIVLDTEKNRSRLVFSDKETVEQALSDLSRDSGQSPLLSQCLFIIMDEESAKKSYDTLSYFESREELQKNVSIMVTDNSRSFLITAHDRLGKSGESINMVTGTKNTGEPMLQCTMLDYISSLRGINSTLLIPFVKADIRDKTIYSEGSMLTDRNGRTVMLSSDETLGVLMVNKKADRITDTVSVRGVEHTFNIKEESCRIYPYIEDNRLSLIFSIVIAPDGKTNDKLREAVRKDIESKINSAVSKALSADIDAFSIRKYLRSAYPDKYNNVKSAESLISSCKKRVIIESVR